MFEQYSVPSLAYCIDSVMSFYQNHLPSTSNALFVQDGLIISFNTASTSVIPILSGRGILSQAKRWVYLPSVRQVHLNRDKCIGYHGGRIRVQNISSNSYSSSTTVSRPVSHLRRLPCVSLVSSHLLPSHTLDLAARTSGCCTTFANSTPTTPPCFVI